MAKYPINLELQGRRVVVIGAGAVAIRKAQTLLDAGARVVIVADDVSEKPELLSNTASAEIIRAKYSKEYIVEASLVIAATNNRKVNERIYKDCQELEIFCNVVDQPDLCDFYVPAVIQRGDLTISVSTGGSCPAFAGHVRKVLEKIFTEQHGQFVDALKAVREKIIEKVPEMAARKALLGELADDESFDYFIKNGPDAWNDRAVNITSDYLSKLEA